jgi:hypothetical protein
VKILFIVEIRVNSFNGQAKHLAIMIKTMYIPKKALKQENQGFFGE